MHAAFRQGKPRNSNGRSLTVLEIRVGLRQFWPPKTASIAAATAKSMATATATASRQQWAWQCQECQPNRECVPIRAQSRCMCGHRLQDHGEGHRCSRPSCSCPRFTFIVAEGSWVLKCRCKHKHTDHSPVGPNCCSKASCSCMGFDSPWICNCDHAWSAHQQILLSRQVLRLSDLVARQAQQEQAASAEGHFAEAAAAEASPPQLGSSAGAAGALNRQTAAACGSSTEVMLAAADLSCEVNRWDLLERGKLT